jgi:glycosyltransferase involved in cell wall biosynthesis
MRFHVVGVANTHTTREYSWHPYTEKVRKFCGMMTSLGHTVYLYAGELNEADCTEHVVCISEEDRYHLFPDRWPNFDTEDPGRKLFNNAATLAIDERVQQGDVLCIIEGIANRPIADALGPVVIPIEIGVGYEATFADRRVFESYAWMHAVYGMTRGAHAGVANFIDQVIPNSYDVDDFPAGDGSGDYLLYVGRLNPRKGLSIVAQVARETGRHLIIAGRGDTDLVPLTAEYVGAVDPVRRAELMGGARCIIAPTMNLEPFGGVVVEAQLCGTPAVTTDWGAFAETVDPGTTGWRCRDLSQFVKAVEWAPGLDRKVIRDRAQQLYSTDKVRHQYEDYFRRVASVPA